jgi:hypothetical protein
MSEESDNPIVKLPKWQQVAIFILAVLFGLSLIDRVTTYYERNTAPTSKESAQKKMIGVWTYTEPINFYADPFPVYWVKWDVRADGSMSVWHASPASDNWGNAETLKYEIDSGKFSTSGGRWYGIKDPDGFTVGVYENGHIILHALPEVNKNTGTMQLGDKNPFQR